MGLWKVKTSIDLSDARILNAFDLAHKDKDCEVGELTIDEGN